jgi:drug/metabolite transporter (DMT)-like permease
MVGITGLFGFHALYFTALRLASPAQAGLISYLWPLFLVIGSDLIVHGRPRLGTVVGGLTAFMGVAVLAAPGTGDGLSWAHVPGYACALGAALVWAAYSVASNRMVAVPTDCVTLFCLATAALSAAAHGVPLRDRGRDPRADTGGASGGAPRACAAHRGGIGAVAARSAGDVAVPTDCVTLFCLATAALSAAAHVVFEPPLNLDAAVPWGAIIGLGVGPVGAAFFLWDFAMKFGDTRMIGFGSFFTPALSTGLLVAFGAAEAGTNLAVACVLIVAGSLLPRLVGDATA